MCVRERAGQAEAQQRRLSPGGKLKAKRNKLRAQEQGRDQGPGIRKQGQLTFSARINVGTWLFFNVEQSCLPAWRVSKADYIIQTRHLHFIIMNAGWSSQDNGQLVNWSDHPLNYVTLGEFINFLCSPCANRFSIIALIFFHYLYLYRLLQIRPLTYKGCGQFAWQPWHASAWRESGNRGELCKIKVSLSIINVLGQRSMRAT